MTSDELIACGLFGSLALSVGLYFLRPKRNLQRRKIRMARKYGLEVSELDSLFQPVETPLFYVFNIGTALAFILIGISLLSGCVFGLVPALQRFSDVSVALFFSGVGIGFACHALEMILTPRAVTYEMRLSMVDPRNWRPGWLTSSRIFGTRIVGLVLASIILFIVYAVVRPLFAS